MKLKYKYFLSGIVTSALAISILSGVNIIPVANASLGEKRCVWSYIQDSGAPEIGEAGNVFMDDDWKKMTAGGWTLKVNTGQYWVFERCM